MKLALLPRISWGSLCFAAMSIEIDKW